MPSLRLPDDRLIWFAHCPKAGGTSVERLMCSLRGGRVGHLSWGWQRRWYRGELRHAWPPNSPQHLTWQDAMWALPTTPDAVFAVVRDPLQRLQSERRWRARHVDVPLLGRLLARLPFGLWLRLVLRVAAANPYAFDNHLRPQTDFIPEGARIFRLEDGLAPVVAWLAEISGDTISMEVPHLLSSKAKESRAVDPRDAALIEKIFSLDYSRFGYPQRRSTEDRTSRLLTDTTAFILAPLILWLEKRCVI